MKGILISLENCIKCNKVKELIPEKSDITTFTLPKNKSSWSEDTKILVSEYNLESENVFPVLILGDRTTRKGFLQIKKYLEDNK